MIKRIIISLIIIAISFSKQNEDVNFQDIESTKSVSIPKIFSPPIIDGFLEDAVWLNIPIVSDFIQDEPYNMAVPTEKTEVKIAYDEQSIYIAACLFDVSPDEITKHMGRRDSWRKVMMSDWFSIEIDSYHDHEMAFEFLVNSTGVQYDGVQFNDKVFGESKRNKEWNAIWESEVSIDEGGWNVEIRIPFSVLRFSETAEITMGMNLHRYIQRKNELMSWVVLPHGQRGIMSKLGHLEGLNGISKSTSPLSISPFIVSGKSFMHDYHLIDEHKENTGIKKLSPEENYESKVGLNIKYLLAQDFVFDVVVNPDYGQIEADPADINLTYYETYFEEKRPFFMENSTLFSTPIELFYSRRIGTNRAYNISNWQAPRNSIVKYAGKISGKTEDGLSFGLISAVTNDDNSSWKEINSNSNFVVGRLTQNLFEGKSDIGFLSTIYNDSTMTNYVNSVDMLSYLWDNQLEVDLQIVNSESVLSGNGNGLSLAINYSPLKKGLESWLYFEYFDRDLNIDDVGYLYRNNLKDVQGGIRFYWPELNLAIPILKGRVDLTFNRMTNLDDLVLANSLGIGTEAILENSWYLGGEYDYMGEYHEDLFLYDYYKKRLGPPVVIPKTSEVYVYMGSDPNRKYTVKTSISISENDYTDGVSQSILFGMNITDYLGFNFQYRLVTSNEKYRWIESYDKPLVEYIFATSNNQSEKYIYGMNYNHTRKTSIQLYAEYYTSKNNFGQFYKYNAENMDYDIIEEISGYYFSYDESIDPDFTNDEDRYLNPQEDVNQFTNDHILNLNMVLNYEFKPGANVYLVYQLYRDVVGKRMNDFTNFMEFIPSETDLAEVNFTQSLYLKVNYQFDF